MANPTTYFGWVMPTSSSLVTNLPADFNTFGQGVDTSLQDLLGGTTGQVLSKTSNTNMDFTWVTPTDQTPLTTKGDIFAFSTVDARLPAGANETRLVADSAQTLGLKYVADTTNYAIAAKGDLLAGTAADTLTALSVGTNGQTLVADSSTATGLKWATPSSGGMTVIQSGSLSSTAVVISSIPQTYKHLQLVMWNTTMSANDGWSIQYNSVTTNYIRSSYGQNGATSVDGSVINDNGFYYGNGAADPLYTSAFNHWVLDIYDYTNTTGAIAARGNGTYFNTSSAYSTYQAAYSNQATAAAITSLTLKSGASKTITGSYILYGVN